MPLAMLQACMIHLWLMSESGVMTLNAIWFYLGPKARPIPALGNAQGTRKPIRSKQLPSPTARLKTKRFWAERWGDQVGLLLFRPQDQGRWPWLIWGRTVGA